MSYKITIVETKSEPKTETETYLLEERPLTDKEVEDNYRQYYAQDRERGTKKIYGSHEVMNTRQVETKIYEQVVETLELKAVIGAINK